MKPILIDSNAYFGAGKGDPDAEAVLDQAPRIGISIVVVGELWAGFRIGTRHAQNRRKFDDFLRFRRVELLLIDEPIAERYAVILAQLRSIGRPIPTNDMWIAATAIEHGLALHSLDGIFAMLKA